MVLLALGLCTSLSQKNRYRAKGGYEVERGFQEMNDKNILLCVARFVF